MKNIYHIYKTSNSYWNSESYETDYYLCDSEEEYAELLVKYTEKRKKIISDYEEAKRPDFNTKWRYDNFRMIAEGKVHASEYFYAHEWQGKTFDAFGFGWTERLERSTITTFYLKPGSVGKVAPCTDPGIGWMYGS